MPSYTPLAWNRHSFRSEECNTNVQSIVWSFTFCVPTSFFKDFFTVNLDGICSNSRLAMAISFSGQEIGLDEANTSDLGLKMADTAPVPEDERRAAIMAKLAEAQAVRKKALVRSGPMVNSRVHTIAYLE